MSEGKKGISPEIVAALIGVAGTIAVAIFFNQGQSTPPVPTAQPVVVTIISMPTAVPTDTVPAGEPTSTPAPTNTPVPTPTEVPPVALGQDWTQGCISSLWEPYPSSIVVTPKNGCLIQPVDKFYASDGRLAFLYEGAVPSEAIYGLFAPLPSSGTVSLDVLLNEVTNGDVWVGIFAEPDINSAGMILDIPAGNVKNRPIVQRTMPGQIKKDFTASIQSNPPLYSVELTFSSGSISASVPVLKYNFNAVPVPSEQKWLFVGYRVVTGTNRIDAEFSNLVIK